MEPHNVLTAVCWLSPLLLVGGPAAGNLKKRGSQLPQNIKGIQTMQIFMAGETRAAYFHPLNSTTKSPIELSSTPATSHKLNYFTEGPVTRYSTPLNDSEPFSWLIGSIWRRLEVSKHLTTNDRTRSDITSGECI